MDNRTPQPGLGAFHAGEAAVVAQNVSYAFQGDIGHKVVLASADLTLKRGEFVILTGPSGAGKTTLMTLIGALR